MIGVSFDLGRASTGYVRWVDETPTSIGTLALPPGFLGEQLTLWADFLDGFVPPNTDWIAYEDARAVSKQHGVIQFGMAGVLQMFAWKRGIPVVGVNQMTAKKRLAGSGRADKAMMLAAARELYPHLKVKNHDQSDAVAVGLCALDVIEVVDR